MFKNLLAEMVRFDVKKDKIAEILNISVVTLYARLSSGGFSFGEACTIRDYFNSNFGTAFTVEYLFSEKPITI